MVFSFMQGLLRVFCGRAQKGAEPFETANEGEDTTPPPAAPPGVTGDAEGAIDAVWADAVRWARLALREQPRDEAA